MKLIQFIDNGTEHATEYAWRLALLPDGTGLYAPLDTDENLMNIASGIASVVDLGGHLTVNKKIHANKESAFIWAENNIPGAFRENITNEDFVRCGELQDISALKNWNENKKRFGEELGDKLGYGFATAVMMFGSDSAKALPLVDWLINQRYDETCERLSSADSYVPAKTGSSCGCGTAEKTSDSSCSALDIYRRYMDGLVTEGLGSLNILHEMLIIHVNGTSIRNETLIKTLIGFIGSWTPKYVSSNTGFSCPDRNPGNDEDITVLKNAVIALGYLGAEEECRYQKFITYWMGRLGELLTKY